MTTDKQTKTGLAASMTRRQFAKSLALATVAAPFVLNHARAASTIKMGAILDLSGGLDIYGKPMMMVMQMAVEEINASGGLNGSELELVTYDTQSNMQLYAQYALQASLQDKVSVVNGGITSASKDAMRPILRRYETPLLYPVQYEGGVCDRNVFCFGATPAMQEKASTEWAIAKWGKRFYSIGADYNAPRIMADWARKFGAAAGGEQIANDFVPMDVTEFGPLITKIQSAKPDFVCSSLVGAAHLGFYRQWAAAGMVGKIPILSFTFGVGNEHTMLPPEESEGIVGSFSYVEQLDTPLNRAFIANYRAKFGASAPELNAISVATYEAAWLWATAVRTAGTIEREPVLKSLEAGASWTGPGGTLKMDGATHHCARDIFLVELHAGKWKVVKEFPNQQPLDSGGQCDLLKDPSQNTQFIAQ
jgi:branched-chain amino acid transport system substrate-binding protein